MQKEEPPPRSIFASLLVTVELEAKENYAAENLRALTFNPSGQEIKSLWFGKTFFRSPNEEIQKQENENIVF